MRNNVKEDAYITVEATVVITMMIFLFVFFIYMVIFSYDRTMLMQNTYMMTTYAKEEYRENKDSMQKNMDNHFSIIYEESPFLSISDISMKLSKIKNKIIINSFGEFITPFDNDVLGLRKYTADIEYSSEIDLSDPVSIMLKTKDILGW